MSHKNYAASYQRTQHLENIQSEHHVLKVFVDTNDGINIQFTDRKKPDNSFSATYCALYQRDWINAYRMIQTIKKYIYEQGVWDQYESRQQELGVSSESASSM